MNNDQKEATTAEVRPERPRTPSGRVKKDPGQDGTATKHVKFSREHIHRGIAYKANDEADLLVPEADALIAMGSAGEAKPNPSRVDVVRTPPSE